MADGRDRGCHHLWRSQEQVCLQDLERLLPRACHVFSHELLHPTSNIHPVYTIEKARTNMGEAPLGKQRRQTVKTKERTFRYGDDGDSARENLEHSGRDDGTCSHHLDPQLP